MKNIAIYVNKFVNDFLIKKIKDFYCKNNVNTCIFIANDNIIENVAISDTAIINGSHIHWMKGIVVFTSIQDFIKKKDKIVAQPVLVIDKKNIVDLTSKIIEECDILISDNTKIRRVKNAELQHLK